MDYIVAHGFTNATPYTISYTRYHTCYRCTESVRSSIFSGEKLPDSGSDFCGTEWAVGKNHPTTTITLYISLWP